MHQNANGGKMRGCTFLDLIMTKSRQIGLQTKVRIDCSQCRFRKWISLNAEVADAMTLNESVVSAAMFAGTNFNNV